MGSRQIEETQAGVPRLHLLRPTLVGAPRP